MGDPTSQTLLIRRTGGNAAAVAFSQLFGKVATLAWLVVAGRVLDQAAFGAFSFALALALLVGALVEWGFATTMVRMASRDPGTLSRFYTSAQAWQLMLGIPAYGLAVFAARDALHTSGAGWVLLAAVVATAAETWCSTARSAASVLQRQGRVSVALTVQRLMIAICAIGALMIGRDVTSLGLGFVIGTVLGVPVHSLALRRVGIHLSVAGLRWTSLRPLLSASHYIGLSGVVLMGLAKFDQVLLGALADDQSVGAYAAAYRLLETVFFVSFALNAALFPVLAANPGSRSVRAGLRGVWAVLCFAYVPYAVVCVLVPGPILRAVFGAPYDETAASSLQWLSVVPLFFAAAFLFNSALISMGRQRPVLVAAITALAVTVVANLILIPRYGTAGAAAATVVGYATQMLVAGRALQGMRGLPRLLPSLLLTGAAATVLVAALRMLPLLPALVVGFAAYVLVAFGLARWLVPQRLTEALRVLPFPAARLAPRAAGADGRDSQFSGRPRQ